MSKEKKAFYFTALVVKHTFRNDGHSTEHKTVGGWRVCENKQECIGLVYESVKTTFSGYNICEIVVSELDAKELNEQLNE